jgi:fumarylacetoacetase
MSWYEAPPGAPFGTKELPYGIFSLGDESPRVGVALGDQIIDVAALARTAGFDPEMFGHDTLNSLMALGPDVWAEARGVLQALVADEHGGDLVEPHLVPMAAARMHLPFAVADYVDFYASEHHARRVGEILRPGSPSLPAQWRRLPIGYHGRAGTVVVSGTDVRRPSGLRRGVADEPGFGPTERLDFEAELGWVVGVGSSRPVPVDAFAEHVFGAVLVNDWSARDIQAYEYVPLGPFLGKSFATSISAWVLPLAALRGAQLEPVEQDPEPPTYLRGPAAGFDVEVEVRLNGELVSRCPYRQMYWAPAQMLAHCTVNGATLRTGDLLASGTISGAEIDQAGSLIELTRNGTEPIVVAGQQRGYLLDGDEVVLSARAGAMRLGEVRGRIRPDWTGRITWVRAARSCSAWRFGCQSGNTTSSARNSMR